VVQTKDLFLTEEDLVPHRGTTLSSPRNKGFDNGEL